MKQTAKALERHAAKTFRNFYFDCLFHLMCFKTLSLMKPLGVNE